MDIRKIIREQINNILNEDKSPIQGMDILNHFPANKLPENRERVNWSQRGVNGWGDVYFPAIDGNGMSQMLAKDDMISYVENFKNSFQEEPVFIIDSSAPWYGKITIINPSYLKIKDTIQSFDIEGD